MSIRINVGATFDAKDLRAARRELDALENQAKGLQGAMGRAGRGMMNFGQSIAGVGSVMTQTITAPLLAAATASVTMAANFSESMSKIVGLVGIASDEVKGMESAVLALSGETAKSPQELADALFVVTSAGLRGESAMNALEAAAKAASAGLGQTNDIARAVAGAMNAYGAETLDAARATDIIVATARAGNFATDQFAGALGRVLPFANQAQASLEDVGGAVALLTRTNGNAAESITQIQALFRAFVVPSEQAKKILDEVGLSAGELREIMGEQGLVAALKTLDSALGGNRERLGRLMSSNEAASAAFQILNADADTLASTFGVVTDSVGMTDEAFGIVSDQAAFKFRAALNDLVVVGIELGTTLIPVVTDLVDRFRGLVDRFNDLTPAQQDSIIKWAGIIAVVGPALTVFGLLITIIGGVTVALGAMSVAMIVATGGLVLIGAAIAGIAWHNFTKDTSDAARALELDAQAAEHAAAGHHALAAALREQSAALKAQDAFNQHEERKFLEMAAAQRAVTAETDAATDAAAAMEDALAALGGTTDETTASIGASGPKVVALTNSMFQFFKQLNETNVGVSDAGDLIAQFSREVLAAGKITNDTARGAENLARAIRQDIDKALADANRRLDEAVSKFESYRDAIAGGIRSGNTIADAVRNQTAAQEALTAAQEAYDRAKTGDDADAIKRTAKALKDAEKAEGTFLSFLETGVTTAEGFAAQIDAVREAGASMEVVQQIAELGAQTGGRIASELLAGGAAAIEQANRMVIAVENASRRAGESAAQQFFGAGVAAAKAMVRGIEATIPELQSVLDRIAEAIERALGTRPNVDISGRTGPFIPPSAGVTGDTTKPDFSGSVRGGAAQVAAIRAMDLSNLSAELAALPRMAAGGIVTSPTFAMIGEAGPEAVIPLDRAGSMGGNNIYVTVTSADPQAVVEALRRYTRANGPLGSVVNV